MSEGKSWHGWHLFDEAARDSLYERCHELREKDPVNETPLGLWRLTRHRDCIRLLREVKAGMRSTTGDSYSPRMSEQARHGRASFMLFQDPPTHTRLRKLVSHAFTPRAIERWRPEVERIANECLDAVADRD
ncbi:MAG TPA: cytochrome P450, partial [Candidatus Binatia bacterium]|nr:cytochrome P450 [Candidatus Binatia bacterium]